MNLLMLGSGIIRRDGWKTLDANPRCAPDFLATIPPLPAEVKAIEWDEIEWIHGITSLYPWDAENILREIHSILHPRGRLILEQPDFNHAQARAEWLFGDPAHREPFLMNRWTYTPQSLTDLLVKTGYAKNYILGAQHHVPARDFRIEAHP